VHVLEWKLLQISQGRAEWRLQVWMHELTLGHAAQTTDGRLSRVLHMHILRPLTAGTRGAVIRRLLLRPPIWIFTDPVCHLRLQALPEANHSF
jgi:hypothetical protein